MADEVTLPASRDTMADVVTLPALPLAEIDEFRALMMTTNFFGPKNFAEIFR